MVILIATSFLEGYKRDETCNITQLSLYSSYLLYFYFLFFQKALVVRNLEQGEFFFVDAFLFYLFHFERSPTLTLQNMLTFLVICMQTMAMHELIRAFSGLLMTQ